MRNLDLPKLLPTAVVVAFTLMIWFVIPVPAGVSLNAWHLFALFVGTIVGIISNAMPLGAISIVAIALVAVTGVTNPGKPAAAVVDALSGFANPLIWLIVIAVMVAMAVPAPSWSSPLLPFELFFVCVGTDGMTPKVVNRLNTIYREFYDYRQSHVRCGF